MGKKSLHHKMSRARRLEFKARLAQLREAPIEEDETLVVELEATPETPQDPETAEILAALSDEGILDPEALRDMIFDYHMQARQHKETHRKYLAPSPTILTHGRELCPECGMEVRSTWRHCAWCGKRITSGGTRNVGACCGKGGADSCPIDYAGN